MPAGLRVEERTLGTGALAERGTSVTIHYRGCLHGGDPLRSAYADGRPLRVHLGRREVIAGLERGRRVGGLRRLVVSPHLAYGAAGVPGVLAPHAMLIVEVELLAVEGPTIAASAVSSLSLASRREAPWRSSSLECALADVAGPRQTDAGRDAAVHDRRGADAAALAHDLRCATKRIDGMDKIPQPVQAGREPLGRSVRWMQAGGEIAAPERYR